MKDDRQNVSDDDALRADYFPLSSKYDPNWLTDGCFGANPLWLAEWLCRDAKLQPGMRVLDLGCGKAKSSVFLAREFGVKVWAVDLWNNPTENWQQIGEAGVQDDIIPLRADARDLPFPHGFFDAILAFDSFQYYGTDTLFLPYVVQFLKRTGILGFASAGLVRDFESGVPEYLSRFWTPDAWCLRTSQWWQNHWTRTGLVNVEFAETMQDGWRMWLNWSKANDSADWYVQTLERDAGQHLGYIRVLARRRPDTPHLTYDLRTGNPVQPPRPHDLSLRPIDGTNRNCCLALSVNESQSTLIAPNAKSLEWAVKNPHCVPLGIYADDEMTGFVMYEPRGNDVFSVHRFMIDRHHQRRGMGLLAMQLVMEKIASLGGKTIYLSFRPENTAAKNFYEKLGYEFHEEESDGELIYRFGPVAEIDE